MARWLTALIVMGLLASGATAWVKAGEQQATAAIMVLPGRHGDVAEYLSEVRRESGDGTFTGRVSWELSIADEATVLDSEARLRRVAPFVTTTSGDAERTVTMISRLELATRSLVHHELARTIPDGTYGLEGVYSPHFHTDSDASFVRDVSDPEVVGTLAAYPAADLAWLVAISQGIELDGSRPLDAIVAACQTTPESVEATCSAHIEESGLQRVLVIERESARTEQDGRARSVTALVARLSYDGASAYPVTVELRVDEERIDGEAAKRSVREEVAKLVRSRTGGSVVYWGANAPLEEPLWRPTWSRVGASHPETGEGWEPTVAVEEALASISADPTLVTYRSYIERHPDAVVVGIAYFGGDDPTRPDNAVGFGDVDLAFAAPGADSYVNVQTYRLSNGALAHEDGTGTIVLCAVLPTCTGEFGERPFPERRTFDPAIVPPQLLTLGSAVEAWHAAASDEFAGSRINIIEWGVGQRERASLEAAFQSILVGAQDGSFAYHTVSPQGSEVSRYQTLRLDAGQGTLLSAGTGHSHGTLVPPVTLAEGATPSSRPRETPSGDVFGVAVGGLLATLAAAYFWHLLKFVLAQAALPLYTRLRKAALLDNRVREALVACIRANPGVSPPALQAAVGAGWSTIVYHLGVLEKNGLVHSAIDGRHRRYFAAGDVDRTQLRALVVLAHARTRAAYDNVRAYPGIDRKTLAELLGVSLPATLWHLQRLRSAGLIDGRKEGRAVRFFPAQATHLVALEA